MSREDAVRQVFGPLVDELVAVIVQRVSEEIAAMPLAAAPRPQWIRGAQAAAEYLNCPRSRVYDMVARGEVEHSKDGPVLMFRPEWLDAWAAGR